jgi:predicted DNA-binding transcriptional regulator YafY
VTAEEAIAEAARALHRVILTYVDEKGVTTTREIEPYSYRPGKDGAIRFMGFDIEKGAIRGFRTDRIVSATVSENTFTPQWPVEIS